MTSLKTTIGGVGAILGGLGMVANMWSTGNWDAGTISMAVAAFGAGWAGIMAKDYNVTNAPSPVQSSVVPASAPSSPLAAR